VDAKYFGVDGIVIFVKASEQNQKSEDKSVTPIVYFVTILDE